MINKRLITALVVFLLAAVPATIVQAYTETTDTSTYGSGNYGDCDYGSCTITLTTGTSVLLNITPSGSTTCSVDKDQISVTTDSTAGYNVTINNTGSNANMVNGANSITASTGTPTSPTALTYNYWGYRVDSISGFGSGPTTQQTDVSPPGYGFAGVPIMGQTPGPIATSSGPANPAVSTDVWYGACIDTSVIPGSYTAYITYSAITNF